MQVIISIDEYQQMKDKIEDQKDEIRELKDVIYNMTNVKINRDDLYKVINIKPLF